MNRVVIGLGSNINPGQNIPQARELLGKKFTVLKESKLKTTKPIGLLDQSDFVNGAILLETALEKDQLKQELRKIETVLGRKRTGPKFGPRPIDLDIVIWNNEVADKDFYKRDFIRDAVREVLPELKH